MLLIRLLVAVLLLATLSLQSLAAMSDEDLDQDILEMKQQLLALETKDGRSLDVYELRFYPGVIRHLTLTDRLGDGHVYYYMVYRLRNPAPGDTKKLEEEYSRYNEILQNVADEFVDVVVEGGRLTVATDTADDSIAVVLDRKELERRERTVRLSIIAYDENGSRIRILDRVPGKGPQEEFNFPDEGVRSINIGVNRVRERIEEREGRRLLLASEIAQRKLPVYTPGQYDEDGNVRGEVHGVVIFDNLSINGDTFEVQVRGLSNKTRVSVPEHESDEIADYWNMRIKRRTYFITYERRGDEYFRGRDPFKLVDQGWRWRNTFQRIEQRSTMAHVKYFFNNLSDASGNENEEVVQQGLEYYNAVRKQYPELIDEQANLSQFQQELPDIGKEMQDGE